MADSEQIINKSGQNPVREPEQNKFYHLLCQRGLNNKAACKYAPYPDELKTAMKGIRIDKRGIL